MSTKRNPVDPVTVEIVGTLMLSIAEETCLSIIKSAYSTNIKERRDVSAAVVGPEGDLVAQADYLPIHLNAFLTFIPYIYQHFDRAKIRPGDMFIGNDPYHGGGNHLPDIVVAMPVFGDGAIIGWVVNMAHHSDIGGMVPGSTSSYADSIFQEGIRIPVIRICNEGKLNEDVFQLLLGNTRVREEREGDLTALQSGGRAPDGGGVRQIWQPADRLYGGAAKLLGAAAAGSDRQCGGRGLLVHRLSGRRRRQQP